MATASVKNLPTGSSARTMVVWVYPTAFTHRQTICGYGTESKHKNFALMIDTDGCARLQHRYDDVMG